MPHECDNETFPLAYLITFRCYGTWLHGDARGAVARRGGNIYGMPRMPTSRHLEDSDAGQLRHLPTTLDAAQRTAVEEAIREVCDYRGFRLGAVNARSNHVHAVVSAGCKPEVVMNAFKAYATRRLRDSRLVLPTRKLWARHGSTRYLWKSWHVEAAVDYVLCGQGDEPPEFN